MTREEAIKNIKEHCCFANLIPQAKEALNLAIKSLEAWDKIDLVARQRSLKKDTWEHNDGFIAYVINLLLEIDEESEEAEE